MAASTIRLLQDRFPVDPSLERQLQERFSDSTQTSAARRQALEELGRLANRRGAPLPPELMRSLIAVAQQEASDALPLDAVTLLATDFSTDAAALMALDSVARSDKNLLVRKIAEHTVSGSAPWREFALATLDDASLLPTQRLEPLVWAARADANEVVALVSALFDGGKAIALAGLLSEASSDPDSHDSTTRVLESIKRVRHPDTVDFWLASVERVTDYTRVSGLFPFQEDPRARRKLEEIAANHPDATMRERVVSALRAKTDSGSR
jgi:hypothetical protein